MPIHCVRNRIFPSRYYPDPRLSLYALPFNDGEGGKLRNHITGEDATLSGGSTLLAQEKFRNDYQRPTSTFPSLGYRASPAWTNLLYALDADNPSFEGGTVGTLGPGNQNPVIISTDAWHGSRCYQATVTGVLPYASLDIKAATAAGAQYTLSAMVKAGNAGAVGKSVIARLSGDTSGATDSAAVTLTTDWQLISVTKTFAAGDTTIRYAYPFRANVAHNVGDIVLIDAISLVAGATVPQFEEKECVATSCSFPTPFSAGEDVSGVIFIQHPWVGNDGVAHGLICAGGVSATEGLRVYKSAANVYRIQTVDAASENKITSVAAPASAGFDVVAFSVDGSNNQKIAVNGTLAVVSAGVGVRESALGNPMEVGTSFGGLSPLNGLILPYIYRGVAWGDEECEYYSSLQAPPPMYRRVG